jgi:hypothetical protein
MAKGKKGSKKGHKSKSKKKSSKNTVKISKAALRKALPALKGICKLRGEELNGVLSYLNRDAREVLYHCIYNCVYNDRIPREVRQQLRDHLTDNQRTVKYLANPDNDRIKKRRLLKQTGGYLPTILELLLPLLSSIVNKAVASKPKHSE